MGGQRSDVKVPALVVIGGKEAFLTATVEDAEQAGVPVVVIDGADHAGSLAAIDLASAPNRVILI